MDEAVAGDGLLERARRGAARTLNAILTTTYCQTGHGIVVIPRLSLEPGNDLPEVKGFFEQNIGRMIAFSRAYPQPSEILPQAVAKMATDADSLLWLVPLGPSRFSSREGSFRFGL